MSTYGQLWAVMGRYGQIWADMGDGGLDPILIFRAPRARNKLLCHSNYRYINKLELSRKLARVLAIHHSDPQTL
jgi:hypothetical protein